MATHGMLCEPFMATPHGDQFSRATKATVDGEVDQSSDAFGLSCTSALEAPSSSAIDDTETVTTEPNDSLPTATPAAPADQTAAEQTLSAVPRARNHNPQLAGSLSFMTQAVQHRRPSSRGLLIPRAFSTVENANDVEKSSRGSADTTPPSATSAPGIALPEPSGDDDGNGGGRENLIPSTTVANHDDARGRRRGCRDARRRTSVTWASPGDAALFRALSPMSAMMARSISQGSQSQSAPLWHSRSVLAVGETTALSGT